MLKFNHRWTFNSVVDYIRALCHCEPNSRGEDAAMNGFCVGAFQQRDICTKYIVDYHYIVVKTTYNSFVE